MFYKMLVLCFSFLQLSSQFDDYTDEDFVADRDEENFDVNEKVLVTINKDREPYSFQKYYNQYVDGSAMSDVPAFTLNFDGNQVKEISNFQRVTDVYLDCLDFKNLPDIINLTSLNVVYASDNNVTHIKGTFLSKSPASKLFLSNNYINTIDDKAIGENVTELHLTCNHLTSISSNWFKNPAKLQLLHLAGNKVTAIPENMFKDFIKLEKLDLRNNEIVTLGFGSLSVPYEMKYVDLSYNKIYEIKPEVFGANISINSLDLQYNRLSFIHQTVLDKWRFIRNLFIRGNPWQCPCKDIIYTWLKENNIKFSSDIMKDEVPACIYAASYSKYCVYLVEEKLYDDYVKTFTIHPIDFCEI